MKIQPYRNNVSSINFGTTYRKVYASQKKWDIHHESATNFFVPYLQWNKFTDLLVEKSKQLEKFNVYSLACSDGSEAYSLAMLLMTKLSPKDRDKFFPIIAVDSDDEVMNNARSGVIDLGREDEFKINLYTKNKLNDFLTKTDYSFWTDNIADTDRRKYLTRYKINPVLKDKVQFVTNDISSFLDGLQPDNNVFFCRNVWRYLHKNSDEISKKLSSKMNDDSYLVIGRADNVMCPMTRENCFDLYMNKDLLNVFTKEKSDYFDKYRVFHLYEFRDFY